MKAARKLKTSKRLKTRRMSKVGKDATSYRRHTVKGRYHTYVKKKGEWDWMAGLVGFGGIDKIGGLGKIHIEVKSGSSALTQKQFARELVAKGLAKTERDATITLQKNQKEISEGVWRAQSMLLPPHRVTSSVGKR